jgi:hypothetical protein
MSGQGGGSSICRSRSVMGYIQRLRFFSTTRIRSSAYDLMSLTTMRAEELSVETSMNGYLQSRGAER